MRHHAYPCRPVAWGVALSIVAHAAIALVAWRAAVPLEAPRDATLTVRLIERTPAHASAAALRVETTAVARHEPARRVAAAPRPRTTAAVRGDSVAAAVRPSPAPPREVVSGAVFALPHIGYGGGAVATSWTRPMRPPLPTAQAAQPDPGLGAALAQREAGRALLVAALEQQVSALPAPVESDDGACTLEARVELKLNCDSSALHASLTPQAPALSGLLLAYRGIDSRLAGLLIGFSNGRYQVSLAMNAEQR